MDFSNLTNDNILMFAIKNYNNSSCHSTEEFATDIERVKYIKRLFKRYQVKGILKERLLLNHIIVLYNVFGPESATRLLYFKLESDLWTILKTFLEFLSLQPSYVYGINGKNVNSSTIQIDDKLMGNLKKL
jgi:hypothetical protein